MRRRDFIKTSAGAAVAWPIGVRAQQAEKLPTVGYLSISSFRTAPQDVAAFLLRLRELGWIEGRTVAMVYGGAEGRSERVAEVAAEFVRLKVDVIITSRGAVPAIKQVTTTIPIVFCIAADPVGMGLVASLARPGGNVTGLSGQATDLAGKRVEFLRQVLPDLRRLAIMGNVDYPAGVREMEEAQAAGRTLGLEVATSEIRRAEDIEPAFAVIKGRADALYTCSDTVVNANRNRITALALAARLPTMSGFREYVTAGGLMSYGPNIPGMYRRAADHVDKILRGTKPADVPVERPTTFDLVINLITAKKLDITVPRMLIARANEVIE
jgi:putative ABC transport system substrate-binding protein